MAIDFNPQGAKPASGSRVAQAAARRANGNAGAERDAFAPPPARAHINFIPAGESLATLIQGAVAALRKGVYWDRGTILNLLV